MFSPYQLSSDCKNYPPEGAAFNEITQSLSRFDQDFTTDPIDDNVAFIRPWFAA